jgi:AcrR family transcriptional regulator
MPTQTESDTQDRLLDAAEKLFAETGIGATSLRAITAEASANLASVHYHFGSKEALLVQVFARRIKPVNQTRFELLDAVLANDPSDLDAVVRAFVGPALRLLKHPDVGGRYFTQLMGRLYSEPLEIKSKILHMFEEVVLRFMGALGNCLPHLGQMELFWRFHYMVGSMAFPMVATDIVEERASELGDLGDTEDSIDRLVRFISAGLSAPATHPGPVDKEADGED